ncbi:MAG: L,D-transpeptidase family protein [Bacillota bacterium]
MLLKITYGQIRTVLLATAAMLAAWLFMGHYAMFDIEENSPEGKVVVNVSFLAPMNWDKLEGHLAVTCEIPDREVLYSTRRISRNTVQITIDEPGYPRGLEYDLHFKKAAARIPPFSVTARKKVRQSLAPKVIALDPPDNVPTRGPLVIAFNTPVKPESFIQHVSTNAPGRFAPCPFKEGGKGYDYSRWMLVPDKRFDNNARYSIDISEGLTGAGGGSSGKRAEFHFNTAPALVITDLYPEPGAPSIWLSRNVIVKANHELKEACIKVEGVEGKTYVNGNTAVFDPDSLFLPSMKYKVHLTLVSVYGEQIEREYTFGVTDLGSQRWIAVKLGNPSTVQVYEGKNQLKSFKGWLSIQQDKIPRVTMYEVSRGSTLEYNPQDNSPVRYIRLNADITVHHLRPGETDIHNKIGLPPSYGCILLEKPDLNWIFENVPGKCMVVVH